jgi:hypothetical protein
MEGTAEIEESARPATGVGAYVERCREAISRAGFAEAYPAPSFA